MSPSLDDVERMVLLQMQIATDFLHNTLGDIVLFAALVTKTCYQVGLRGYCTKRQV